MYRGDIPPKEAFERLQKNASAVLIDVRTQPEWTFVGVPQVDRLMRVSWQVYPQMDVNGNFANEVKAMGLGPDTKFSAFAVRAHARRRLQLLWPMRALQIAGTLLRI